MPSIGCRPSAPTALPPARRELVDAAREDGGVAAAGGRRRDALLEAKQGGARRGVFLWRAAAGGAAAVLARAAAREPAPCRRGRRVLVLRQDGVGQEARRPAGERPSSGGEPGDRREDDGVGVAAHEVGRVLFQPLAAARLVAVALGRRVHLLLGRRSSRGGRGVERHLERLAGWRSGGRVSSVPLLVRRREAEALLDGVLRLLDVGVGRGAEGLARLAQVVEQQRARVHRGARL
mmetsp:Transcript_38017/g.122647  ORF Transcript_38017/g.122647 Transcript_38017/m.122647 type:complete len:235 (+) Transcript_38017:327-1031(+)